MKTSKPHLLISIILFSFLLQTCLLDTPLEDFDFPAPNVGILEYQDSTVIIIYPDPSWEEYDIEKFHIYKRLKGKRATRIASISTGELNNGIVRYVYLSDVISLPTEFGAISAKSYTNLTTDILKTNFSYSPSTFWVCNKIDDNTVRIGHVNPLLRVETVVLEANINQQGYSEIREWEVNPNARGLTNYDISLSEFNGTSIDFRIKYRNAYSDTDPTSSITIIK